MILNLLATSSYNKYNPTVGKNTKAKVGFARTDTIILIEKRANSFPSIFVLYVSNKEKKEKKAIMEIPFVAKIGALCQVLGLQTPKYIL